MMLKWQGMVAALVAVAGGLMAVAVASDDDSEPLYVVHNGKRIPTVIIPPGQGPDGSARPAVLEVIELDPQAKQPTDVLGELDHQDEQEPEFGSRRYAVGQYAGYPVSIPRPRWSGWGYTPPMPPSYYGDVLKETYRARRWIQDKERGRVSNVRDMKRRKTRLLASHEKALRTGLENLRSGSYAQAVVALHMAAQLNHGDPACRIHLAQARMAQGHYEEAGKGLRRALQLQPKLAYVSLDLRSYYSDGAEFDTHADALAAHVKERRRGVDTWFLHGYMEFQRGNMGAAYSAFRGVARVMPKDSLTSTYVQITKPARK